MKCYICKKELNLKNVKHIYFCAKNNNINISKKDIRYKQICYNYNVDFDKDLLFKKYIKDGWSLPDFKKEYGLSYEQTEFLLNYFDIKKRNISEAAKSNKRYIKYTKTCRKKYGVENVSQSSLIKEKKQKTFVKHYGVDNIWKQREYYVWLHEYMLDTYGKKSLPNKYGNMQKYWDEKTKEEKQQHTKKANEAYILYWNSLTDEQKNEIVQKRFKGVLDFASKLETRFCKILNNLCLSYIHQFWINRKSYDFRINNTKIIFEIQGDFWHCNPKQYKADDIINFPGGYKKVLDIWEKDFLKKKNAEKYNYKVLYLWESDFKKYDDQKLSEITERKIKDENLQN